jgi:small conductance mechanosensitive channel
LDLGKALTDLFNLVDRRGLLDFLVQTVLAVVILFVALALGRLVRRAINRVVSRASHNANLPILLSNLVYVVLLVLAVLLVLSIYTGTGLTTLLAAFSVLGVALSLSLQDVLKNFVAGVYLLLEQPFSIGDRIKVRDVEGKVENIRIRTTSIHTDDGVEVFVPNSVVFGEVVTNRTAYRQRLATVHLSISTATLTFDELKTRIKTVMAGFEAAEVSADPEPQILVETISPTQTKARVEFWSPISAPPQTTSDVILALTKELPEAEISGGILANSPPA